MPENMIQILQPDGSVKSGASVPKLSEDQLKKLYNAMVLTRLLDERMMNLQRQGRIGFCVTAKGQEAMVAAGLALRPEDWVFPAYREHAVGLIRGFPLKDMVAQYFGNELDLIKGRQMPNHFAHAPTHYVSVSSPIGTQISHAAGAAIAAKLRGDPVVAITFFGDGGTSASDFHAGLNFAGDMNAPCIFYCANNQYAISVPVEKQTRQLVLAEKAKAYGFPGIRVDGNDVFAIYQVVSEAAARARAGRGPTLIEAYTFRMGPHSSSDDPTRYCPKEKFEEWQKKDPISRLKVYLTTQGLWNDTEDQKLTENLKGQIQSWVETMQKGQPPKLQTMFEDVYAHMPTHLKMQYNELLEEAKTKGTFSDTSEAFPL